MKLIVTYAERSARKSIIFLAGFPTDQKAIKEALELSCVLNATGNYISTLTVAIA